MSHPLQKLILIQFQTHKKLVRDIGTCSKLIHNENEGKGTPFCFTSFQVWFLSLTEGPSVGPQHPQSW